MRLDLPGLEAFLSIAERGSFHAAASHLNLSQTALSHRIRKLEELLGVTLIARTTRSLSLTPAGVELLPKARRLIEDMGAAFDGLSRQAREQDESVVIGCLPTVAVMCLPETLRRFRERYPGTAVRIHDNSASEIADKVQAGEAAFGITIVAANRWSLDLEPIVKEPFVLVCRRGEALADRASLTWAEIKGLPLIRISAETGNRILIDDALGARRDLLTWRYEVQRVTTAVGLVKAGVGAAVVPQLAFDLAADRDMVAIPLKAPLVTRTLGAVTRRGAPISAAAAALLAITREVLVATVSGGVAVGGA
jgi:DNA-binding transcriptional LysR family regulator